MSNKTSDKNVANIEIIENFIFELKSFGLNKDTLEVANELENLLSDYTRQKQINEEHKRINGELRERVKELEEIVNCCNIVKNETLSNDIVVMLKSDFIRNYEQIYIPKQVVIDKIEENKQILDKTNDGNLRERLYIENGIMKELLEGGENEKSN